MRVEIKAYTSEEPQRKRACINCGRRINKNCGSKCGWDGHYIPYVDTWDDWCKHWTKGAKNDGK